MSFQILNILTQGEIAHLSGMISNGNWTEWSPIRSVIIQVIHKIGWPRSGSPIKAEIRAVDSQSDFRILL